MEKEYGELMSFLLQSRLRHGSETRFREHVMESVRTLARDLRDFGLDVHVQQATADPVSIRYEAKVLKIGCE